MKMLYAFRGAVLGVFAVLLLALPPGTPALASGIFLLFAGICLRVEARTVIGIHSRGNLLEAPELLTGGIYARIRHPLYASNILIALGLVLLHLGFAWESLFFGVSVTVWFSMLACNEDRFLRKKFNGTWEEWRKKTPAFFPKFRKSIAKSTLKRGRIRAFTEDRATWLWLLIYLFLIIIRRKVM